MTQMGYSADRLLFPFGVQEAQGHSTQFWLIQDPRTCQVKIWDQYYILTHTDLSNDCKRFSEFDMFALTIVCEQE